MLSVCNLCIGILRELVAVAGPKEENLGRYSTTAKNYK